VDDARVVDQDVEAAEGRARRLQRRVPLCGVAHVERDGERPRTELTGQRLGGGEVDVGERDAVSAADGKLRGGRRRCRGRAPVINTERSSSSQHGGEPNEQDVSSMTELQT